MSICLIIATVTYKPKETDAISIPIALQGAAGVYVIGGLLVAAGAGLVGYEEHGEEIKAHTLRAWDNATQISKDSLNWSIEAANGLGNGVVSLQTDFQNFIDGKLSDISNSAVSIYSNVNYDGEYLVYGTWRQLDVKLPDASGFAFAHSGGISSTISIFVDAYRVEASYYNAIPDTNTNSTTIEVSNATQPELYQTLKPIFQNAIDTANGTAALTAAARIGVGASKVNIDTWVENKGIFETNLQEQWTTIRDAGLVLPVDEFVPISATGEPLTYNPATGALTGIDGGIYTGDHTWQIPNVSWRDKTTDIPEAGVWVETPVRTGNPTYDDAITQTPTITNITTGTTIANPDIATGNPGIPGGGTDPPPGGTTPKLPGTQPIVPIALLLGLFDLLRAILMYLSRMFTFLVTLPFVTAIPIENPYFQWFRTAKILGVQPYPLVMTMATFFMSFAAFKSIRRFLP